MTYRRHAHAMDVEIVTEIATRIYCTRLSLGYELTDMATLAEDALAIYQACAQCVEEVGKAR